MLFRNKKTKTSKTPEKQSDRNSTRNSKVPSFRASLASIQIHSLTSESVLLKKGDILYYEWMIDENKGISVFANVQDGKLIEWPLNSGFSFKTFVNTEDKTGPYINDKFLIINFRKHSQESTDIPVKNLRDSEIALLECGSSEDIIIGILKIDYVTLLSVSPEVTQRTIKNETFSVIPVSDKDDKFICKASFKTKIGGLAQVNIEADLTEFSEISEEPDLLNFDKETPEIDIQLENEKMKFSEYVIKTENEKREYEQILKITREDKLTLEVQLKDALTGKKETLLISVY